MDAFVFAIVSGVHRGPGQQADTPSTIFTNGSISSNNIDGTKRLAPAGSIGNIFDKRKKKE